MVTHLLWTGGWDSTFRLLDLVVRKNSIVQPYYLIDPDRLSTGMEIHAMMRIRSAVSERFPDAPRPKTTIFRNRDDLRTDPAVKAAIDELWAKRSLGTQYRWLHQLAQDLSPIDLELTVHRDDKAHKLLEGAVIKKQEATGSYYKLIDNIAGDEFAVFAPFRFPIFELTKLQMQEIARAGGFAEILELTWFCHRPTAKGEPCGCCLPCTFTRDEGLGRRIPLRSKLRRLVRAVQSRRRRLSRHLKASTHLNIPQP